MANRPNIRFEGYTDDWEQRKLSEVAEKICVGFVGTCEKYYTDTSGIPMYRTGNLNGLRLNQEDMKYVTRDFHEQNKKSQLKKGDILIARHGDSGKAVNYELSEEANCLNIVIIRPDLRKCNYHFLADCINSPAVSQHIKSLSAGSTQAVINTSEIEKLDVTIPANIQEQNKIAEFIDNLDNLITLHQRKCDETKELKKYMLQKMFPKNGEKRPEIRFEGFNDDWEQRKLGEVFEEYSEKKHEELPPLTIIQGGGTILREESDRALQYDKNSLSGYKMVKNNDFIVHLRSFEGGLEKANSDGIISPAYHTFHGDNTDSRFYYPFFRSRRFIDVLLKPHVYGIRDGKSIDIEGMKTIMIPVPSYAEQRKIGEYIESLDNLITLHQRKCDELKEVKKYMLQNMFPGRD